MKMREIIFRFYVPKFKEMYDVIGIDFVKKIVFTSKWPKGIQISSGELIQFTGLIINKKEIYTKDIVDTTEGIGVVEYSLEKLGFVVELKEEYKTKIDIFCPLAHATKKLGDIYQNPELLKK